MTTLGATCATLFLIVFVGGCAGSHRGAIDIVDRGLNQAVNEEPRFGRFVARPGNIVKLPDFSIKVYGIIYRYDWPEASFTILNAFSTPFCTLGAGEVDYVDLEERRSRVKGINGQYEGLRVSVEEVGRDKVVFEIEPYDTKLVTIEGDVMSTYTLNVGDRLLVPGGSVSPREVDHQRGTFRLWFYPEGGQSHGQLIREGEVPRNIDFPDIEIGTVQFTDDGVQMEVRQKST